MFAFCLIPTGRNHTLCTLDGEGVTYTVSFSGHDLGASCVASHIEQNDHSFSSMEISGLTMFGKGHVIYMDSTQAWRKRK